MCGQHPYGEPMQLFSIQIFKVRLQVCSRHDCGKNNSCLAHPRGSHIYPDLNCPWYDFFSSNVWVPAASVTKAVKKIMFPSDCFQRIGGRVYRIMKYMSWGGLTLIAPITKK